MFRFKRADESEIGAIQAIADATWKRTYSSILSKDQIDYMYNWMYSRDELVRQIQNGHLFYFIYNDLDLVGFASIENVDDKVWKLHKIYVVPQQQGKGAGKALLEFVINKVRSLGGIELLLNVNRQNIARCFYEKNGLTIKEKADIDIGNGYFMNDYIMTLPIERFGEE